MSARVIVTQKRTNDFREDRPLLKHHGYDVDSLGLGTLGGLQILSDPGYEITAIHIVEAK